MRYITVLLAVLLILGAGILAAGCTMPEGDGTQQTPMGEETPMETETPMEIETPMEEETPPGMEEETPPGMEEETLIGGEAPMGGQAEY
ncbi:hypothetical protein FGW20_09655 [Methanoculleus sp. FWC-SCC3]|uniref:Uncharacterized protein n=1 Tax=Methanoculleus methanifontis TaxID=2584086 RepID=A0ABT8M2N9_9EURY|nr:hypothetical protein [Methanoculleus sp. FWC-SCC3]MDN7013303.1 hypothetical protein [Methanoculleus sp. FWC-SCC3]